MRQPETNIPKAIVLTLVISMTLYVAIGFVATSVVGANALAEATHKQAAPLVTVARHFEVSGISIAVSLGAVTAMLGVLLNLILGLSRVALAMGRRSDLPPSLAKLDRTHSTPFIAVVTVGLTIAGLTLIGNVKTTWSFSAFTVLVYYALTNLAAIRLSDSERLYPRFIPWLGLMSCLLLAFWVDMTIWLVGLGLIGVGLFWQQLAMRLFPKIQET